MSQQQTLSPSQYKTVYLSGPMSGIAQFNRPAFDAAAAQLRSEGFTVLNPPDWEHEISRPTPANLPIRRFRSRTTHSVWNWDGTKGWWVAQDGTVEHSNYTLDMALKFAESGTFTEITPAGVEDTATSPSGDSSVRATTGSQDTNPVVSDEEWVRYLRRDVEMIATRADAIVVLPQWEQSRGAWLEMLVAQGLGLPVFSYDTRQVIPVARWRTSVLHDAFSLTERGGDRHASYGHPLDDFSRTAALWSALLGTPVSPEAMALCMIAVKLSRECNQHKRDNLVDICGYASTLMMVHEERARRLNASAPQKQEQPTKLNGPSEVSNVSA